LSHYYLRVEGTVGKEEGGGDKEPASKPGGYQWQRARQLGCEVAT